MSSSWEQGQALHPAYAILNGMAKKLPSMNDFVEVVGLQDVVESLPNKLRSQNFESLYSNLYNENAKSSQIVEIQKRVHKYFSEMHLPKEATIYDYLILSLRERDLIASFNWDPFLFEAWSRNYRIAEPTNTAWNRCFWIQR